MMLACHPAGRVREAALEALDQMQAADCALGVLLVRLNDWVEPIRQRARTALGAACRPEHVEAWAWAMPLLDWLRRCRRGAHGTVIEDAETLLREAGFDVLLRALDDRTRGRTALRIAMGRTPRLAEVIARAARSRHPAIRRRAAQTLREASPALQAELLAAFDVDLDPAVQMEVLRMRARTGEAIAVLRGALFATRPGLRRLAQHLAAMRGLDPAGHYRDVVLASERDSRVHALAFSGLGETGTLADLGLVLHARSHPAPGVRAAALRAAAMLAAESAEAAQVEAWAWEALADASPPVAAAAAGALRTRCLDPARIAPLLAHGAEPLRRRAARLIPAVPWWDRPPLWLAVASRAGATAEHAVSCLQHWARHTAVRVFSSPDARQRAEFAAALRKHGDALDPGLRTEIEAIARARPAG